MSNVMQNKSEASSFSVGFKWFGVWHYIVGWVIPIVLEDYSVFIVRVS